jgi:hypothetical protein
MPLGASTWDAHTNIAWARVHRQKSIGSKDVNPKRTLKYTQMHTQTHTRIKFHHRCLKNGDLKKFFLIRNRFFNYALK